MMGVYANAFPRRNFAHIILPIDDLTNYVSRYDNIIRRLSFLLNCQVLRNKGGRNIMIVGRKESVEAVRHFLKQIIDSVEMGVILEGDYMRIDPKKFKADRNIKVHGSTHLAQCRAKWCNLFEEHIKKILVLKSVMYLPKYSVLRKVEDNELLDQTFFTEYKKANRLTHLKLIKWNTIS